MPTSRAGSGTFVLTVRGRRPVRGHRRTPALFAACAGGPRGAPRGPGRTVRPGGMTADDLRDYRIEERDPT
ncbi:hypothetical protein, partial [Saccharopolyspora sp. 7B]|uniref:hypothetical protein n=1 Tax=Saccharopolyspora sp. 7B TaxID=2877240 RepID=UPI001CD24AC4